MSHPSNPVAASPRFAVILPAAGASHRFGADKLRAELAGESVLSRTVGVFAGRNDVALIVLAVRPEDCRGEDALDRLGIAHHAKTVQIRLCSGGNCRAESVRNALRCIPDSVEWVAVHDAARPMLSQNLIDQTLAAAMLHGAAVPALPVALTIKRAAAPLPARVVETLDRSSLWTMQTPQIMRREVLIDAFARCPVSLCDVTDDMQLLELIGEAVWLIPGDERNLKLTTAIDLQIARLWLAAELEIA